MSWGCPTHEWDENSPNWENVARIVARSFNPEGSEADAPCPDCLLDLMILLTRWYNQKKWNGDPEGLQAVETELRDWIYDRIIKPKEQSGR
jgi:hypothetical protein